jgi:hypothetical protein
MGFVIREKNAERYIACVMHDGKVPGTEQMSEALVYASEGLAQNQADAFSNERGKPGMYIVVEKALPEGQDYLYMIRENRSMEYVAVIALDSVGTTKVGSRAIHYRDEVIANEQAKALMADQSSRTYTVIVSQTSVGIR